MIDKFGKVMVYAENPKEVANFFVNKIGFKEVKKTVEQGRVLSVTVTPNENIDTYIEFFDINIVKSMMPELNTGTPSICFSTYNLESMRNKLIENGVLVGDVITMGGVRTFNFADIEKNYFAVAEIESN